MASDDNVMNATQAAALLGVHVETVRRLARRGEIPSFKVGTDWRFSREILRRWFEEQRPRTTLGTVLVVDDDPAVLRLISRVVERLGYRAQGAIGGRGALELVSRSVPDLILLDMAMPGMNGADFLDELRPAHPDLPVVIVTGYPDSSLVHRAAQHAPVMLLTKPLDLAQLERTLRTVLGNPPHAVRTEGTK
ncbi:MAG: response regulator [Candidatus Eisenbacteria bacterium]